DGNKGQELWISNGEKAGTERLADINPGAAGSFPTDLLWLNQRLFFAADDGSHGRELWSYSTTDQTSALVLDIQTSPNTGSNPGELTKFNESVIFAASDVIYGRELWISDGTATGTRLLEDINPGGFSSNPGNFSLLNGQLYFTADSYLMDGSQIMKLDKNSLETTAILTTSGDNTSNQLKDLHSSGDQLFYSAETVPTPPSENSTDATASDPGGFMVAKSGIEAQAITYINNYNDNIDSYRRFDDTDFLENAKFWAERLLDSSLISQKDRSLADDWNQYFQSLSGYSAIQVPQGTPSTAASRSTTSSPGGNNQDTETLGRELWISNGEANGNSLLMDINPGTPSSTPSNFSTIGSKTYFSADDGVHGIELWVSDGTTAGTTLLVDINEGPRGSSPRWITESNGDIYFSASRDDVGRELWRLDEDNKGATRIVSTGQGKKKFKALDDNADEFRFELADQFGKAKADRIIGFRAKEGDQLALSTDAFPGLSEINLVTVSSKRQLKAQRKESSNLIYFEAKGKLYFDQNGDESGYGEDGGLFAILKGGPDLTESAFRIL
ncbi:MAG: hypothetical protein ISQ52_06955, partial [Synechococcus sp. BS307-5m-G38]|nr:hypothetical protein [Synechococcus sp. BS307-5m-G38]